MVEERVIGIDYVRIIGTQKDLAKSLSEYNDLSHKNVHKITFCLDSKIPSEIFETQKTPK